MEEDTFNSFVDLAILRGRLFLFLLRNIREVRCSCSTSSEGTITCLWDMLAGGGIGVFFWNFVVYSKCLPEQSVGRSFSSVFFLTSAWILDIC